MKSPTLCIYPNTIQIYSAKECTHHYIKHHYQYILLVSCKEKYISIHLSTNALVAKDSICLIYKCYLTQEVQLLLLVHSNHTSHLKILQPLTCMLPNQFRYLERKLVFITEVNLVEEKKKELSFALSEPRNENVCADALLYFLPSLV